MPDMRRPAAPVPPPIVAILSYNRVDLLRRCIDSLFRNTRDPFRICVVDQASSDGTRAYLRELGDRVDHVATESNLGFVLGNNLVMERYPDRDVVLLNNDTEVCPGWLEALSARACSDPSVGIVGAKLVFPDGRLQAAGGEIFSDASGREIGKYDDPDRYIYNQFADVDYVSGACMYVKRAVLAKTGPFDPQFAPAYWEDTDLCFSARKAGFRVVYEPAAVVTHHEGGSFGSPREKSRSAELQARNRPKFIAKWKAELARRRSHVFEIPPEGGKDKILVILPFLPIYDRAAGEMRWFHTLRILRERYQVVFLARNGRDGIRYINPLEEAGITVFHTDTERLRQLGCEAQGPLWIDFPRLLAANRFKAIIVGFYHVASQYYRDIRTYSPDSFLVIDSYDVAFLRERRRAEISGKDADVWQAEEIRRIELEWYRKADMALTVTEKDRDVLLAEDPTLRVGISTDIHPLQPFEWPPDRKDLVFVGNFNHQPNEDAVLYFAREILPLIHREIPEVRFYIVGNAPTPAVEALAGDRIVVTGFVPDLLPYFRQCRVCVVPIRYGAGLKGKVGQAMAAGIPQVSTSVGAEGMGLVHERDVLVADRPQEFAREVVRLYRDEALQRRLAGNARDLVAKSYSYENAKRYWEEVFDAIECGRRPKPAASTGAEDNGYRRLPRRPEIVPRVSIVIPVWNQLTTTETCWASIRKNTHVPCEVVVVDNGSDEPVKDVSEENNFRCIRNERNLGFAAAVNQGIRNTLGDYVVVLNNDCVVTPGWLERLLAHLEEDPRVGVVAPVTNYANNEQRIGVSYRDEASLYRFSEDLYLRKRGRRRELPKVVGMCMLIPRTVIEDVGLFDTRFGIGNFEDDDFCLRVRLAGYSVVCAEDVFVHHEGGVTFRRQKVDYERLLRENGEKFRQKWAPVRGTRPPEKAGRPVPITAVCYAEAPGVTAEDIERTLSGLPSGIEVRLLVPEAERFEQFRSRGIRVRSVDPDSLWSQVDADIRSSPTPQVLVIPAGARSAGPWLEELLAAAGANPNAGFTLPRSDRGRSPQRVRRGYRTPEDGLSEFTEKNRRRNAGLWKPTDRPWVGCALVRRDAYRRAGGLPPEFRSGAGWIDLAGRLAEVGAAPIVALGSYVHLEPGPAPASDADPVEERAVDALAECERCVSQGDPEGTVRLLEESLAHKPDYARALYDRALVLRASGRLDEAEEDLRRIEGVNPRMPGAKNVLGCIAFERGRSDDAERHFLAALGLEPDNREISRNLGDLYFSTGRLEKALNLYRDIVRKDPKDPRTFVHLGDWFAHLGDRPGAEDWYRQALTVAPGDEEAGQRLASLARPVPQAGRE